MESCAKTIEVIMKSSGGDVPLRFDHQFLVYSSILNMIRERNGLLSKKIHETKAAPLFVMSQLNPISEAVFSKNGISADSYMLKINTWQDDIADAFNDLFSPNTVFSVGKLDLVVERREIRDISVSGAPPAAVLKTLSPIVLRTREGYIRYGDKGFEEALTNSIMRKTERVTGNVPAPVSINILNGKKKLSSVHGGLIPCSHIKFEVMCDRMTMEVCTVRGIGAKTQIGFGMVVNGN